VGGGVCTEEDIPHRTKFTKDIIEAWKQERKEFADDMKVRRLHTIRTSRPLEIDALG